MLRESLVLACLLAMIVPGAGAYRDCYLNGQVCANYDWRVGNSYVDVESSYGMIGAGQYSGAGFDGYGAHVFTPGTYVAIYDGVWYGDDFTLVNVGVSNAQLVWYYQDSRTTEHMGAYHCFTVTGVYSRCGTGLP